MKKRITLPNFITSLRMLGTLYLLVLTPLTTRFFIVYTLTGITDVLDGWIARKMNQTSDFGAVLDSIADLLFYTLILLRILPVMRSLLPGQIWYAVGGILLLRVTTYLFAAIKYHHFAALHTRLNKLTGFAVFSVPYILLLSRAAPLCWCVCVIAAAASAEEFAIHISGKTQPSSIIHTDLLKKKGYSNRM